MFFQKNKKEIVMWLLITGFGLLYLSLCFNHNVWTDEAFTMHLIKEDFKGILQGTMNDVHPPLYYIIAKAAALLFSTQENRLFVQKIVAIIPLLLTMGVGGNWLLRKKLGLLTAVVYIVTLGFIPCTMEYAVQVRMYTWALLFVTLCGLAAYDAYCYGRKRDWIIFVISGVAAAYTHNFSFVAACIVCGFLFLAIVITNRGRLRSWCISILCMIILYAPWFFVLLKQIHNVNASYWIPEITMDTIGGYFRWAFGTKLQFSTSMLFSLFVIAGVFNIIAIIKKREREDIFALFCWLVPFFTTLSGVIVSGIMTPIYYDRYVFPAIGLLCLFFAVAFRKMHLSFITVLLVFLGLTGMQRYKEIYVEEYLSTYTEETEAFFEENLGPADVIVYNWEIYGFIYEYYFGEEKVVFLDDMDLQADFENIWFICTKNNYVFTQQQLSENGLEQTYIAHMGIEQNEFDIYRIYRAGE